MMSSFTLPAQTASRHLSDADVRETGGAGTMDQEGFLTYHAAEYAESPLNSFELLLSLYNREGMVLSMKRQAERLLQLRRPDWDGYGARPISRTALDSATRLVLYLADHQVVPPRLFPLVDGGVRLEWASPSSEVWIDIPASGEALGFFEDERTGEGWEGPLVESPDSMLDLLMRVR
jgi:hypothetical protein